MLLVSDLFVVWTTPEKIETKFGNTRFFVPQNVATNKALVRSAEWAKEAAGLFYNIYLVVGKLICVVFILRQLAKVTICSRNVSLGAKTLLGLVSISCTTFRMETATRVWMSDVDTANHTFNVFKIAENGFKEVHKKDMEEVAKPQNAMMTDELRKYSAFPWNWFFGGSKEDLCAKLDNKMNHVVKKVMLFFPGWVQKKNHCVLKNSCQ